VAPCLVQLGEADAARLRLGGGRAVKRLAALTGCSIEVPPAQAWAQKGGAVVGIRLAGGAKQRRLAARALREAANGLDPEDALASASGSLVHAHGLAHEGRKQWLSWRLVSLEHGGREIPAEVTPRTVRVALPPGGEGDGGAGKGESAGADSREADERRAALSAAVEAAVEEAQALAELTVEAPGDPAPETADAEAAIESLAAQHGLFVRVVPGCPGGEGGGATVHVLGPPDAARDAAALLWERFAQGRATAAVLQAAGRVQAMSEQMAKDFERDLQDMETECGVRVHPAETMLWIDGPDSGSVARAREMLCEVLLFYLPGEFLRVRGLRADALRRLGRDAALRALAASPGCAVALEREGAEGVAWLCGPRREEARRRIAAVAD